MSRLNLKPTHTSVCAVSTLFASLSLSRAEFLKDLDRFYLVIKHARGLFTLLRC